MYAEGSLNENKDYGKLAVSTSDKHTYLRMQQFHTWVYTPKKYVQQIFSKRHVLGYYY